MKLASGIVLGLLISAAAWTLSAQNERAMHPRIARAIEALRDARAYMQQAPHDFGGHRVEAIRPLNFALAYRGREDRR